MSSIPEITEEESLELYEQVRQMALLHNNFRFPVQRLDVSREVARALVLKWKRYGWVAPAALNSGPGIMGNWILPEEYRAYKPGDEHVMSTEEREEYLQAARASTDPLNGKIGVRKFETLASREALWRLIDSGDVVILKRSGNREYRLIDEHRLD